MPNDSMISEHAETLNALSEMQASMQYAVRRPVLERAELIITSQERELREMKAEHQRVKAALSDAVDILRFHLTGKRRIQPEDIEHDCIGVYVTAEKSESEFDTSKKVVAWRSLIEDSSRQ